MGQVKKKSEQIPLWAQTGHAKPVTRRDFLAAGLIPFAASMVAPSWLKLLLPESAEAAMSCPAGGSGLIPFVTVNLAGGAAMGANFVPMDAGGNPLPSYNLMGLGKTPAIEREFGNVPFAGNGVSKFLQGLRAAAPTALAKTAFVAIPVQSRDDTSVNKFGATGMVAKAGLVGSLLPSLGTRSNSVTGISQGVAVVAPPSPLTVSSFNNLTGSLGYAAAIGSALNQNEKVALAKMISNLSASQSRKLASIQSTADLKTVVDCAGIKNQDLLKQGTGAVDPRQDSAASGKLNQIWGINGNTNANSQSLIFGSMTYNALKGTAGAVSFELGGYDYHNNTRTTGDNADQKAGTTVGQILESAAAMGRPVFVYVCSDGAVSSSQSDNPGAPWASDRGTAGVAYMLYYNPAGRPATSGFQVGRFTKGQVADDTFITGGSPEAAAAAVFANYLAANKRTDLFNAVAGRTIDANTLPSVIKIA
jgi:hypothetical protein